MSLVGQKSYTLKRVTIQPWNDAMLEETGFQIPILLEFFEFSMSSGVKVSLD